jgi:hypothetical protein
VVSSIIQDREEEGEEHLLLCGIHEGTSGPSGVLREVPLPDVGIVVLELVEEFVCSWEASVWLADAGDAVDDELL